MAPPDVLTLPVPAPAPQGLFYYLQQPLLPMYSTPYAGTYHQPTSQAAPLFHQGVPRPYFAMPARLSETRLPHASTLVRLPPALMAPPPILDCALCSYKAYGRTSLDEHYVTVHNTPGSMTPSLAARTVPSPVLAPPPSSAPSTPPVVGSTQLLGQHIAVDNALAHKRQLPPLLEPPYDLGTCPGVPPQLVPLRPPGPGTYLMPAAHNPRLTTDLSNFCADGGSQRSKAPLASPPSPARQPAGTPPTRPSKLARPPSPISSSDGFKGGSHHSIGTDAVQNNVLYHIRDLEAGASSKTWHCTLCGRVCSSKSSLRRHIRRHKGLRPFHCSICPKAYTAKHNLDYHMRSAHPLASPVAIANRMKQRSDSISSKTVAL